MRVKIDKIVKMTQKLTKAPPHIVTSVFVNIAYKVNPITIPKVIPAQIRTLDVS